MRYRFRQWVIFDCNWKVALEAFLEPYHVKGTHPQLMKYGDFYAWSKALGLHGNDGFDTHNPGDGFRGRYHRPSGRQGRRCPPHDRQMQEEFWQTIGASTTETLVNAAKRLVEELPAGTPPHEVHRHWLESARRDDAARGVIWPNISDKQMADAGLALSIFPNMNILPGPTFALYYRVRPYGTDPDKCIYEAIAMERFPRRARAENRVEICGADRGKLAPGHCAGLLEHDRSAARPAFPRLSRHPAQPASGAEGHQSSSQSRPLHGTRRAAPALGGDAGRCIHS